MGLKKLIEKCANNDRKAQAEVYQLFSGKLFALCLKYSKNYVEAQDNLQDGFITIFNKIGQYNSKGSFEGWMKRIVINTCLDVLKKKKIHFEEINEQTLSLEQQNDESWSVDNNITKQLIEQAIEKLPPNYKSVVQLFLLEGYDHQEIAQVLDITQSASRTKLHRGKIQLQQHLKQLHYGTGY